MNVLILSPYPREGASFRFRVLQYLPYLESQGIRCTVRCFLTSEEFAEAHRPGRYLRKAGAVAAGTMRLIRSLGSAGQYDAIVVHRALHPLGLAGFGRWLERTGRPVVLDVDDAIYLPQPHGSRALRYLRNPAEVGRLTQMSRLVLVSNEHLAGWFRRRNPSVMIVPTTVDTERFTPLEALRSEQPVTVGWIGSPSTADYLAPILPALSRARTRLPFELRIIGAGREFDTNGLPATQRPWQLDREVEDFQALDIGLYPLADDPWAAGKGGFKSLQYMSVGVPVIASSIGVNCAIIQDGVNGWLARNEAEWIDRLGRLLEDAALRRRMGLAGRQTIVERYATAVHAPRLAAWLRQAAGGAPITDVAAEQPVGAQAS